MRPRIIRISPYAAADPNGVSLSQTPAAGGIQELTITGALASGGEVAFDTARQVVITSAADESGRKFIVTGRDSKGNYMSEAIVGANIGTSSTVKAFTVVTSIQVDDDTAGAIEAGTATAIWTNWVPVSYLADDFEVAMGFAIGSAAGSLDIDVEMTLDNILTDQGNLAAKPRYLSEFDRIFPPHNSFTHSTMTAMAADTTGNLDFPVRAIRLRSEAVITTGPVSLSIIQGGYS
jgi:hypothetical protein